MQTGEVDNSVLYAGYQYDEETGLYYINARMYDPVTAQFLQRDTYAGTMYDPLSLNLYTYCLNNPHKYVDPTGHFVITAALILMAVRIGISVVSGVVSAKAEYDRQVAEGDNYTNWGSVIFVGVANAGISFFTFGLGQGAAVAAGAGAKAVLKHVGKAVLRDVALGAVADAGVETARQLVTGTKITNLEYDRITEAGVYGGINGGVSSLAGAGLEGLMRTRVAQKALVKLNVAANKGANAIKNGFEKIANKNGKTVGLEAVVDGRGMANTMLDPYALMKERGVIQTLSDAEIDTAKSLDYQMNLYRGGRTTADIYSFGNKMGPRGARPKQDFNVESFDSIVGPEIGQLPRGASNVLDVNSAFLSGHFHKLPAGTPMPDGLGVVADGIDVLPNSLHGVGHYTIFPTRAMTVNEFNELYKSLPWQYGGRK